MADRQRWRPILFKCPRTGHNVQALIAEETTSSGVTRYETVSCLACSGIHLIDPIGRNVLGATPDSTR
jgi:hypothetical protein